MCRIAAIKSRNPLPPAPVLQMMIAMQKGHDNSGFAMVMQDLDGVFAGRKDLPLLSMACTPAGLEQADEAMDRLGFELQFDWRPEVDPSEQLDIQRMPLYVFRNYQYPGTFRTRPMEERKKLLVETRLALRKLLAESNQGYVYSFWPDVLTLKEIGDPRDIAEAFHLWKDNQPLQARVISAQCRQNTNYQIVRYAAHPFFLEGYTLMGNGENTFYQKNRDFQQRLNPAYTGFESDTQCFLYTLHYVVDTLGWPIQYYKHVITPLPFEEMARRPDAPVLQEIRQACQHLEINGPNTVIFVLPDGKMGIACDAKKLRPVVVGRDDDMVVAASEVCGINMILPDRNSEADVYPGERELVIVDSSLEVQRWPQ
ncbi:MAG: glutamate synthase [Anaerolineales bacterium]|jgi:glutamate synthase domain-containing protein 1